MKDYRCTEYDCFPTDEEINKAKKDLLSAESLSENSNHYLSVSKRGTTANDLFRKCYYNKCVYCGVPVTINARRLFEVDHYICKSSSKLNVDFNNIENLVNACNECNRKKFYEDIPDAYLDILNPNKNISKVFIRDSNYKIEISPSYASDKYISKFYIKLFLCGDLRRLDYLLMNLMGLQKKIKSRQITEILAHCIQLLLEKRNMYIE